MNIGQTSAQHIEPAVQQECKNPIIHFGSARSVLALAVRYKDN